MKLLLAVGPARMKFSPMDDELYQSFRKEFAEFDVVKIDEDSMKSKEGKEKWRNWVNQYKDTLKDFNFGSLLRTDPTQLFSRKYDFLLASPIPRDRNCTKWRRTQSENRR